MIAHMQWIKGASFSGGFLSVSSEGELAKSRWAELFVTGTGMRAPGGLWFPFW